MRISDWSSDVCSSDLQAYIQHFKTSPLGRALERTTQTRAARPASPECRSSRRGRRIGKPARWSRASLSKRTKAWERSEERRVGKRVSVCVDVGGRRIINKKKMI